MSTQPRGSLRRVSEPHHRGMTRKDLPDWAQDLLRDRPWLSFRALLKEKHGVDATPRNINDWASRGLHGVVAPLVQVNTFRPRWISSEDAVAEFVARVRAAARAKGVEAFEKRKKVNADA